MEYIKLVLVAFTSTILVNQKSVAQVQNPDSVLKYVKEAYKEGRTDSLFKYKDFILEDNNKIRRSEGLFTPYNGLFNRNK